VSEKTVRKIAPFNFNKRWNGKIWIGNLCLNEQLGYSEKNEFENR